LILLRHGESAFNAAFNASRTDPGIVDAPLTAAGTGQAHAAAAQLETLSATRRLTRIVTSPYARALATAEIAAARLRLPVTVEPLVRERAAFACDTGTCRSQLVAGRPHLDFAHLDEIWWHCHDKHGAEPEEVLHARCRAFGEKMVKAGDWAGTIVVTHWGFIRACTGQAVANGSLTHFDPRTFLGATEAVAVALPPY
jgi:broad specificity phosphatase PhoE